MLTLPWLVQIEELLKKRSTKNYVLNLYSIDASLEESAYFTKYLQPKVQTTFLG